MLHKVLASLLMLVLLAAPSLADPIYRIGPTTVQGYSASTGSFAIAATPTDLAIINGGVGRIIKVQKIIMTSTQTTAGINNFFLVKRSTANTGGTAVADTKVPHNSASTASVATVQHYTANPGALGTVVGNVLVRGVLAPAPGATTGFGEPVLFEATDSIQPITLNGAAEGLAVNFAGAALPTGLVTLITFIWSEE